MATLQAMLDEQARITAELQRMEDDDTVTEEKDGSYRDTLIERWKELDEESKPIIARMEEIKNITRAAAQPANRESGDGGVARMVGSTGPEFMQRKDPLADREETRDYVMLPKSDVVARAGTLAEQHNKRGLLEHDRAEHVTQLTQAPSIARHCLMYGGDGYYDAFQAYVNDPTGPGLQRAAGALSLASAQGGYLLPYFLDQVKVA